MTNQKESVIETLNGMGIEFREVSHQAVYTIDDMAELPLKKGEVIAKNLFVRDARGKNHFLICLPGDKQVNLKEIRTKIGSTPLSFASEDRLQTHLGLAKGAVTPFGVINNSDNMVQVYFDTDLKKAEAVGFHPNDNTATLFLSLEDVVTFVKAQGNSVKLLTF